MQSDAGDDLPPSEPDWLDLRHCRSPADADQFALVLAAAGIPSRLAAREDGVTLQVLPRHGAAGRREIALYLEERAAARPPPVPARRLSDGLTGVLVYATLLVFLFSASARQAFSSDWLAAGAVQVGRIVEGEWWRIVTALGLHADFGHLLGNLIVGGLFGLLLTQSLGTGLAWFSILLAGAAGNALSVLVQPPTHGSIGASTAVFAALGILAALTWRRQMPVRRPGVRRWLPLGAGVMLLFYLGTGGERTDVVAHLAGFVAGIGAGAAIAQLGARLPRGPAAQRTYGMAALLLPAIAWTVALHLRG